MKIDNDLKVAYPLYVSAIYIMLGFEWRKLPLAGENVLEQWLGQTS